METGTGRAKEGFWKPQRVLDRSRWFGLPRQRWGCRGEGSLVVGTGGYQGVSEASRGLGEGEQGVGWPRK